MTLLSTALMPDDGTMTGRRFPWLTVTVFAVTTAGFALQLADERVLDILRRDPDGLQWTSLWRVVTALLIQSDGWGQAVFNLISLLFFGVVVEQLLSRWAWLGLYLGAGIVGQLVGYAWNPPGGGNSVAVCGLVGAVIAMMLLGRPALPGPAYLLTPYYPAALLGLDISAHSGQAITVVATALVIGLLIILSRRRPDAHPLARPFQVGLGALLVAEAVALLPYRDHHGAALLTGVVLGLLMVRTTAVPVPVADR